MDVRIIDRVAELGEGFRETAVEKVARLARYDPRLLSIQLVFDADGGRVTAEARADVPSHPPLIARAKALGHRAALDRALARLGRQLRKERSKRVDHQAPPIGAGNFH